MTTPKDYTHFLRFESEAEAKAALPNDWVGDDGGWSWIRSHIDGPIIVEGWTGYHLNYGKTEMDTSLPGLIGIWCEGELVYGDQPTSPQVTF